MRGARSLLVVLAVGAVAAAWVLARREPPSPAGPRAALPGIAIVCLDTLRADLAEADGGAALPSLAAFRREGTTFSGALAACSWTGPSVTTLLTGLLPWHHGVLEVATATRLAPAVPTLASTLRAAGWSTTAVTGGGWLGEGCGLPAGFDRYDADFDEREPDEVVARWQARRPLDRPFLLFLHTYAAHDPYGDKGAPRAGACPSAATEAGAALGARIAAAPPGAEAPLHGAYVEARYGDPCVRDALRRTLGPVRFEGWHDEVRPFLDGAWRDAPDGAGVVARLRAAYAGPGLRHVERRLAATLAALRALPAGTAVVVCSDHGEAFGEHGALYHGRVLPPELVRTVLVVRAPGFPAGRVVPASCGLVDVTPTLLALAGVAPAPGLDGVPLQPLLAGGGDRVVTSVVVPPPDERGGDASAARRVSVRDGRHAWLGRYDVRAAAWVEEAWYARGDDPEERRPLPAPPDVGPAFVAAVAAARAEVERRFAPAGGR